MRRFLVALMVYLNPHSLVRLGIRWLLILWDSGRRLTR